MSDFIAVAAKELITVQTPKFGPIIESCFSTATFAWHSTVSPFVFELTKVKRRRVFRRPLQRLVMCLFYLSELGKSQLKTLNAPSTFTGSSGYLSLGFNKFKYAEGFVSKVPSSLRVYAL